MSRSSTRLMLRHCSIVLVVATIAVPSLAQVGSVRPVHDPCMINMDGKYYLFSTGLGGNLGIPIRRSDDLFKWDLVGEVFPTFPDWAVVRKPGHGNLWAPHIQFFNDLYHLYYAVSTFGTNNSAIGLATNKTLDSTDPEYRWKDCGIVVETRSGRDDWNAIDPAIAFDQDRNPWLICGSFWTGIKACKLDARTGKVAVSRPRFYSLAERPGLGPIEAPFVVRHGRYYYLFVSFDHCCKGTKSDYKVVVGRSREITGPYLDYQGLDMRRGGGTLVIAGHDQIYGPGHNAVCKHRVENVALGGQKT